MKKLIAFTLSLLVLCSVGCGEKIPPIVEAHGVVKINGQPAGNLSLQFHPVNSQGNIVPGSLATSDAQGKFVLKTTGDANGAVIGKHRVTVWDNNLSEDDGTKPGSRPRKANRIPSQYLDAGTTPIEIEVVEGKKDYVVEVKAGR